MINDLCTFNYSSKTPSKDWVTGSAKYTNSAGQVTIDDKTYTDAAKLDSDCHLTLYISIKSKVKFYFNPTRTVFDLKLNGKDKIFDNEIGEITLDKGTYEITKKTANELFAIGLVFNTIPPPILETIK